METQKQEAFTLRWEIKESDYIKRKNRKRLLIAFSFLFFLLGNSLYANHFLALEGANTVAKFLSRIGTLLVFIYLIWYYFTYKSKCNKKFVRGFYKINEKGILINKSKENIKNFYSWSDLDSYYSLEKALPIMSPFFKFFIGDNLVITDKNGKSFNLRANNDIKLELELKLSEHLKFKQSTN
ncbi:MAG: hypothetical protein KAS78_00715 [Candidatus Pacebacteria bacterium]|nr:hypothetical protein [Candidatus Paceibacterota bacterium]